MCVYVCVFACNAKYKFLYTHTHTLTHLIKETQKVCCHQKSGSLQVCTSCKTFNSDSNIFPKLWKKLEFIFLKDRTSHNQASVLNQSSNNQHLKLKKIFSKKKIKFENILSALGRVFANWLTCFPNIQCYFFSSSSDYLSHNFCPKSNHNQPI